MRKNIIVIPLILLSSFALFAEEIKEGTITNRDILDALDMKAWSWDIHDKEGFRSVTVDVEVYERNKANDWEKVDVAGHGFSSSDMRHSERVVLVLRDRKIFLKVGQTYSDLSIKLDNSRLKNSFYHNVNSIGEIIDGGFIIMSEYIEKNRATTAIDDRNFYVLVKITTNS